MDFHIDSAPAVGFAVDGAKTFVHNVDITVRLDCSGTAHITEIWDMDVQTGTEWYLVQGNLGAIEIRDLAVSDETGKTYLREDVWDTHRTIEAKAGRCGLVYKGDDDYDIAGARAPTAITASPSPTR